MPTTIDAAATTATAIDLNDLPAVSEHARRLLNGNPIVTRGRNRDSTTREYDERTYAPLFRQLEAAGDGTTMEDIRRWHLGDVDPNSRTVVVSIGDELAEMTTAEAHRRKFEPAIEALGSAIDECRTIVDLGAGYGQSINRLQAEFPGKTWVGADASRHAVLIAQRILGDGDRVRFFDFNFYDAASYGFIGEVEAPILVMTNHAIEQLPTVACVFDGLGPYREQIARVVHFEPVYRPRTTTVLGLLRARYIENQDYNRDLLAEIERRPDVRLIRDAPSVFGMNPLNPTSIVEWVFC